MCSFTEILSRSSLFGGWVRLSLTTGEQIQQLWQNASIVQTLRGITKPISNMGIGIGNKLAGVKGLLEIGFLGGMLLLLAGLTFLDTTKIGVITWGLCLLALVYGFLFRRSLSKQLNMIDFWLALFLGSAVVSTAFSSYLTTSVIGLAKMLTFVAGYIAFRFLAAKFPKWQFGLLLVLTALGTMQSLIGFNQYFNHVDARATWTDPTINAELNMTRIFGSLQPANPNLLAGFLLPCMAAAFGAFALAWPLLRSWANKSAKLWVIVPMIIVGMAGLIFVAVVLTGSRGGFLAIAGMSLTAFAATGHLLWHQAELKSHRSLKIIWVTVLVVGVLGATGAVLKSPQLQQRLGSIFAMRKDSSISYRLNVYHSAQEMFKDNPIVGIGPGNGTFKKVYGLYMVPGFNALGAYSVPLEILVEQGIVGFLIFLGLVGTLKLRTIFFLDSSRPLNDKILAITLWCGIVGSILYGIFDTIWYRPSVNLLFWLFVALLGALTQEQKRHEA